VLSVFAAGCAYIGDVRPPLLEIPAAVTDLRAAEYADKISVEFTLPLLTTEGETLKNVRAIELEINAPDVNNGSAHTVQIPPKDSGFVAFDTPVAPYVGKRVMLAVRVVGSKGKASLPSNVVALDVHPPLATPSAIDAANSPKGVRLTWSGSAAHYRVYRAQGGGMPARLGESDVPNYEDATVSIGTAYRYYVQAIDGDQHQSVVSAAVSFTPQDVFPPAVPEGLAGVPGVGAIELVWQRNIEDDFAGYNLYRSTAGGAFQKIAGPIGAPAYSDHDVEAGKSYRYAVSALDRTGNESARTAPIEVTLP
jgi:fibronectin type 3 domain-containing protein